MSKECISTKGYLFCTCKECNKARREIRKNINFPIPLVPDPKKINTIHHCEWDNWNISCEMCEQKKVHDCWIIKRFEDNGIKE